MHLLEILDIFLRVDLIRMWHLRHGIEEHLRDVQAAQQGGQSFGALDGFIQFQGHIFRHFFQIFQFTLQSLK